VVVVGGVTMLVLIAAVYYASFVIHFEVLKFSGSGDVWHDSRFLASTLINSRHDLQGQQPMSMFELVWELNRRMYEANSGVTGEHSYGSLWYEWPMMIKGMSYWVKNLSEGKKEIFLGGNLIAYATTTCMIVLYCTYLLTLLHSDAGYTKRQKYYGAAGLWLVFGYLLNWAPYVKITRVCFIYHYVPSFYLAVLLSAVVLDKYFWSNLDRKIIVGVLLSLGAIYFYGNYPTYYGNHFVFNTWF
jgi:dolichyl-phosphate-mannose-protein mannosyltransferase